MPEDRDIIVGSIWKHFKGHTYRIVCIARDTEDMKEVVVYQDTEMGELIWVRPLGMFLEELDEEYKKKYPNLVQKYRFEKIK